MKIYKVSQRMFDTYDMENVIVVSFKRHYEKLLNRPQEDLQRLQMTLDLGRPVRVGIMRIGYLLDQIIAKHGEPSMSNYPRTVIFILASPDSVWGKGLSAFFSRGKESDKLFIGKVVKNIHDIQFDENFLSSLHHEFQHLLTSIYSNDKPKTKMVNMLTHNPAAQDKLPYYSKSKEIQAYCAGLARTAIKAWIDVTEHAIRKWAPEKILEKIPEWRSPRNVQNTFNLFVLNPFLGAFKQFDAARGNIFSKNPDLKKKYLYFTYRNCETIINRYLDGLEQRAKASV